MTTPEGLDLNQVLQLMLVQMNESLTEKLGEQSRKLDEKLTEQSRRSEENSRRMDENLTEKLTEKFNEQTRINKDQTKELMEELSERFTGFQIVMKKDVQDVREELQEQQRDVNNLKELVNKEVSELKEGLDLVNKEVKHLARRTVVPSGQPGGNKIKLPRFDGTSSWSLFKTQFEMAAEYNGWDSADRATNLAMSLQGQALYVLHNVPQGKRGDFLTLLQALEARFGDEHLKPMYQAQLTVRKRKTGESLQEYAADIDKLTRLTYGDLAEDALSVIAVTGFINGLTDPGMVLAVQNGLQGTLWEAVGSALKYEAVQGRFRARPVRGLTAEEGEDHYGVRELRVNNRKIKCYRCGKEGHISRDCRAKLRSRAASPNKEQPEN